MLQEKLQQRELARGQLDSSPVKGRTVKGAVEDKAAVCVFLGLKLLLVATKLGPDARKKDLSAEWLGDVVVGAHVKPLDDVRLGVPGRNHDDGDVAGRLVALEHAADGETVYIRKHQVKQDQVRMARTGLRKTLVAVGGGDDVPVARRRKGHRKQLPDGFVVLDYEYPFL